MILGVASAAILTVSMLGGWSVVIGYQRAMEDAGFRASNLADALANHVALGLADMNEVLHRLATRLVTVELSTADAPALQTLLTGGLFPHSMLAETMLADSNGTVVARIGSAATDSRDVRQSEFFAVHRDSPSLAVRVNPSTRTGTTGEWRLILTRRLSAPDGSFAGIIVTNLGLDRYSSFYRTVMLGGHGVIELLDDVGRVVADSRRGTAALGSVPAAATVEGSLVSRTRSVPGQALQVRVGLDDAGTLAAWRSHLPEQVAVVAVAVSTLLLLLGMLLRQGAGLQTSEARARRHDQTLRAVLDSMADAVLVADAAGRVRRWNPVALRTFGTQIAQPDFDPRERFDGLFLPDGTTPLPSARLPFRQVLAGHSIDDMELVVYGPTLPDAGLHVLVNGRPMRDAEGVLLGAVIAARDVTSRRELEAQLSHTQRIEAIGRLTGGVAHDFNNILTVVMGNIEELAQTVANEPGPRRLAERITMAAKRGADLTHSLLSFARRQPLRPRELRINELVEDIGQLLRRTIGEQVGLQLRLAADAAPAFVDPAQLQAALVNLAINARDAMPDGGRMTIETLNVVLDQAYADRHSDVAPGGYLMLAVSDTGTGIAPEIRDRIFEPFFTTKEAGHGSGLGLSMVYGFVKQSGGHIKVYSELGEGTTMKLYLPLSEVPADPPAAMPTGDAEPRGTETVLLVEDDDMVRENGERQVAGLGYKVFVASDAAAAVAIMDKGVAIDLLFTDVVLPDGMNGPRLAAIARARQPGIKVLFTSGYTENAVIHHGRLDSGVHLLSKPYMRAELARMLRLVLDAPAA